MYLVVFPGMRRFPGPQTFHAKSWKVSTAVSLHVVDFVATKTRHGACPQDVTAWERRQIIQSSKCFNSGEPGRSGRLHTCKASVQWGQWGKASWQRRISALTLEDQINKDACLVAPTQMGSTEISLIGRTVCPHISDSFPLCPPQQRTWPQILWAPKFF